MPATLTTRPRLLRITTASISLKLLLRGQFTFFQQQGFEVLTVSADGPEVKDLQAEGIAHQVVPMTRKITPMQDLICLWHLVRVIQKFKPDLVHTHTPKAGLLGMLAAWIGRVPLRLHTVAGLPLMEASGWKRKILAGTERITYACATQVYPNSKGLLSFMAKEFQLADAEFRLDNDGHGEAELGNVKYQLIGKGSSNGIDARHFARTPELEAAARSIREQYQIPAEALVFSFVGRVVRDKGLIELVEAFQRLSNLLPARLLLIGPFEQDLDPLPPAILTYIHQCPEVIAAGFQRDVRPWLLASDVFVFPSYREGFPNVVMQAACLEVPSIVSDINGCNEIIEHEVSGIIVPPKNSEALYEAMVKMAQQKTERIGYAAKARDFVTSHFDQSQVWQSLLRAYHQALLRHH